MKKKCSKSIRI